MTEKSSGLPNREDHRVSSIATEMREGLAVVAGPRLAGDTRESWLARGARRAGISYRQAKSLFYGEAADPRASVVEKIRAAKVAADKQVRGDLERLKEDVAYARAFLANLEARVAAVDPGPDRELVGAPRDRNG